MFRFHRSFRFAISAFCALQLPACSTLPYNLADPQKIVGVGYDPQEIIKSLRCEIVTFIEENKLRAAIQSRLLRSVQASFENNKVLFDELYANYIHYQSIKIDARLFAALYTEFKNINTLSATLDADWKYPSRRFNTRSITDHGGLSYSDTATYDLTIPLAISQSASLGPSQNHGQVTRPRLLPGASVYSTAYFEQPSVDAGFYCYKSLIELQSSSTIYNAADDIQNLVEDNEGWHDYANFRRVYVGQQTLAHWLQTSATASVTNQKTIFPTSENGFVGQLGYMFILDVKPGVDLKYTLVGKVLNPLIPSVTASIDHQSTFMIYINTEEALNVLNARSGNGKVPVELLPSGPYRKLLPASELTPQKPKA